ncbi:tRNA1(Val) (adenine(37)-N6)-methyltransferase [Brumimicrobium oceani]|uniref:Methyltransferase small domain-containing protein n=1 Tax=Brumimicrobium oceani TaxID=2100725 RepID=A0A2U2XFK9_9FLAO|nr:methyltransferase [Brumimicrobium oceani]PWH86575.1 hypothetical protein DIT68_04895 [Brumimicrobium oceani]
MSIFKFKKFNVNQSNAPQKIGTDAMILGALANPNSIGFKNPKAILDVGTGCGVIALMLAQHFPESQITGIDIDDQAVQQADLNFKNAKLSPFDFKNDFQALHYNFLEYSPIHKLDLIVSNPPYFNTKMPSSDQQRSLARHESSMSLQELINHSAEILNESGELWLILPSERTEELVSGRLDLKLIRKIDIYGKPNRHVRDVLVFSKTDLVDITTPDTFTIRDGQNQYTEQYKALTIDFHFNQL